MRMAEKKLHTEDSAEQTTTRNCSPTVILILLSPGEKASILCFPSLQLPLNPVSSFNLTQSSFLFSSFLLCNSSLTVYCFICLKAMYSPALSHDLSQSMEIKIKITEQKKYIIPLERQGLPYFLAVGFSSTEARWGPIFSIISKNQIINEVL